ncbi:MAG: NAD(+) synthase [Alphaproteobacteria bacterium]|nr:NAD(+) synthase [Alphaproteobacteria bacterium]
MENLWIELKQKFKSHCEQNGFTKVILGLSGGLDSALVSVLAADVLGGENVTAIMMRTNFTSSLSIDIAREIAKFNNLNYHEVDIQNLIDIETVYLKNLFGQQPKSIVLENLQARARAKLLMAWSNQFGGVVLACSNKSEILTGYCTLYGDTCGAFVPLGNIYKSDIFKLAKYINGINRVLPQEVIIRAPSAELALNQKDENSLPSYDILDDILKQYVDEKLSVEQIVNSGKDFATVERVIKLYQTSAFKRKQIPPIL